MSGYLGVAGYAEWSSQPPLVILGMLVVLVRGVQFPVFIQDKCGYMIDSFPVFLSSCTVSVGDADEHAVQLQVPLHQRHPELDLAPWAGSLLLLVPLPFFGMGLFQALCDDVDDEVVIAAIAENPKEVKELRLYEFGVTAGPPFRDRRLPKKGTFVTMVDGAEKDDYRIFAGQTGEVTDIDNAGVYLRGQDTTFDPDDLQEQHYAYMHPFRDLSDADCVRYSKGHLPQVGDPVTLSTGVLNYSGLWSGRIGVVSEMAQADKGSDSEDMSNEEEQDVQGMVPKPVVIHLDDTHGKRLGPFYAQMLSPAASAAPVLPLVAALITRRSTAVIDALLTEYKEAAGIPVPSGAGCGSSGELPLEIATRLGATLEVRQAIFNAHPLLLAGIKAQLPSTGIIAALHEHPEGAKEVDERGMSVLHCALEMWADDAVVMSVLQCWPAGASQECPCAVPGAPYGTI